MENEYKRCRACGRLYEVGRNGVCRACQRSKEGVEGQDKPTRRKKHKPLRCDCGKPAVTVKTVRVGGRRRLPGAPAAVCRLLEGGRKLRVGWRN